ncbi:OB-fold domain-containing protein [Gordonia sinesedis]
MTATSDTRADRIRAAVARIQADGASASVTGRDPINQPMIHNWVEAMGDANPIYVDADAARAAGHPGIVAPPAMAQVWTMRGLHGERSTDDPLSRAMAIFDDAGYTSVVATNCDTTYHRYAQVGEEVGLSAELVDIVGPKNTALGEGWFFTTRNVWTVGDEVIAEMDFRILKFRPADSSSDGDGEAGADPGTVPDDLDPARMLRPSASRDTQFFWDGVAAHELRVQELPDGTLCHPPVPATWTERDADGRFADTGYRVAAGTGTVYSYVVHHAPQVPGRSLPFVVALVELDRDADGQPLGGSVRMLGELRDVDPTDVRIGMPVRATFLDFPANSDSGADAWALYAWQPAIPDTGGGVGAANAWQPATPDTGGTTSDKTTTTDGSRA